MEIRNGNAKRFRREIRKQALEFAESNAGVEQQGVVGGIEAYRIVNIGHDTPVIAAFGDMVIPARNIAVILYDTALYILLARKAQLICDMGRNARNVFCYILRIRKHGPVHALEDIPGDTVPALYVYKIGIVDIAVAERFGFYRFAPDAESVFDIVCEPERQIRIHVQSILSIK